MWGVTTENEAKKKISDQSFDGTPSNLEEQAISMIGKDLYEKVSQGVYEKTVGR